jgi:hypothetical protein
MSDKELPTSEEIKIGEPKTTGNYGDIRDMNINDQLGTSKTSIPYSELRSALNGAKTLTPLFAALVGAPGIDSSRYQEKMEELINYNNLVAKKVIEHLVEGGVKSLASSRAIIGRQVAEFIAVTWTERKGDLPDPDNVATLVSSTILSSPNIEETFTDREDNTARIVSESIIGLKILPVFHSIQSLPGTQSKLYIGNLKPTQFVSRTIDRVMSLSNYITNALIGTQETDSKDRQIALSSISGTIGSVVAASMTNTMDMMSHEFKNMSADKRQEFRANMDSHPEGILLDRVLEQSSRYIDALYPGVNLEEKLSVDLSNEENLSIKAG